MCQEQHTKSPLKSHCSFSLNFEKWPPFLDDGREFMEIVTLHVYASSHRSNHQKAMNHIWLESLKDREFK